ncbi:hypothetical protein CHS0354_027372 [Potamilus streckersoni]|uniref:Cytochrome c domain-containing protein n=1 Tax=Potamilus streckersoni TaxID=2493646 RepID=A0AAE0W0M1_9BIVA|nr:hypothetical protein CHS0354_027372 [Potamilus streckersoni]
MQKGCTACHGANAQGNRALNAPALAGLEATYVLRQLQNFKLQNRGHHAQDLTGKIMIGSAQVLKDEDMQAIAEYLSQLPLLSHKSTIAGNPQKGKELFTVCASCHGEQGLGNKDLNAPPLAGLQDWYIVSQLEKFKSGIRGGDAEKEPIGITMPPMAQTLADKKASHDVAQYILSLNHEDRELYEKNPGKQVFTAGPEKKRAEHKIPYHQVDFLHDVPLRVIARFGKTKLSIRDVMSLKNGSVCVFDKSVGEPIDIVIGGKVMARGEIVIVNERFGVRLSVTVYLNPVLPSERYLILLTHVMHTETLKYSFASDNTSGICPEVMKRISEANSGFYPAYGNDELTQKVCNYFREIFDTDCDVFFVFNGTAANSLSLAGLCQSYNSVVCHKLAHIETDECGAPEFFSNGAKLLTTDGKNGKLEYGQTEDIISKRQDIHYPVPKVISITQSTEVGTVYSPDEIKQLALLAKNYNMYLHMDGTRFANALAFYGCQPAELSWRCGVDVLCLGGTKNGMPYGEAVIFFNKKPAEYFAYRCKQSGQLASKMRYISAGWLGLLENDTWLNNARKSNEMARYLRDRLPVYDGLEIISLWNRMRCLLKSRKKPLKN